MSTPFDVNTLGVAVGAAGALGTACSGIVEGLKWTPLGTAGFSRLVKLLGPDLMQAVKSVYGAGCEELLRTQYRQDWSSSSIGATLRQGVRSGLKADNASSLARALGNIDPAAFAGAVQRAQQPGQATAVDGATMAAFGQAVDTRVENALAGAQDFYHGSLRLAASVVAIALSEATAYLAQGYAGWLAGGWLTGLLVGIIAVPLAPVANDVANALQATSTALRSRS